MNILKVSSWLFFISLFSFLNLKANESFEPTSLTNTQQEETSSGKHLSFYHRKEKPPEDQGLSEIQSTPAYDQGYGLSEEAVLLTYNFPSRIDVKDPWDVFIDASYIYWQMKERGLEYGLIVPADVANENYTLSELGFDFQSGFKVTLGTNFEHDNWTAVIKYIRLHGRVHNNFTAPNNGYITPLFIHNSTITNEASHLKAKWGLSYDVLNLEFARPSYTGTRLLLRPYVGMTGGWIDQTFLTIGTYLTSTFTIYSKTYSNSWLIGPRVGLDTNWLVGYGFDLKANLAGSLPYQKIKSCFKQQDENYSYSLQYRMREKIGQITPIIEAAVGFGWGSYFDEHKWHFGFQALYEFSYYFDQNQMREVTDLQLRNTETKPGDLMLQGLSVSLRLDF